MTFRQEYATSGDIVRGKTTDQLFCSLLPAPVGIIVESDIDDARAATELAELVGVEMRAQRAGYVGEARMPQRSIVEQAFNQDDLRTVVNLLPAIQTALAAGQDLVAVVGPPGNNLPEPGRHWDNEDRFLTRVPLLAAIRQDAGRKRGPAS